MPHSFPTAHSWRRALTSAWLFLLLAALSARAAEAVPRPGTYSLLSYGAAADGRTNDREALQRAIDAAHAAGGGTVEVPAGRQVLTGSFALKSHVTLHLAPGSRLLASTEQADYRAGVFIEAFAAEEIAITGTGTIDGQGIKFMAEELPHIFRPKPWRPKLMVLEACRRVRLRDFTIRDSAQWAVHLTGCDDVVVDGLTILNNLKIPNCDGIDPDHSKNVRISNCHIEAGDDCIVIKNRRESAQYGPAENIVVTNCTLVSTSAALKIGTETVNDVRDVIFSNCVIRGSHRGVALMLRDEGSIENVLVHNLTIETRLFHPDWWGAAEPISITALPRTAGGKIGRIRGVRFDQIVARGEGGVLISGSDASVLEDIVLNNVHLEVRRTTEFPLGRFDLRPLPKNEPTTGALLGFQVRHARDITLRDCSVRWALPVPTSAVALRHDEAASGITVEHFREFGR
jgi:polygalacturonase